MMGPTRFRFLNHEGTVEESEDWQDCDKPKLWLYHLHYFQDLNSDEADCRDGWHRNLIQRWIEENPPGEGVGWEPFPTSLRIVNWIKWSLWKDQTVLPDRALHSLAIQTRWLEDRLERHLQGNHLLANAKALMFAGLYFRGQEAGGWYRKGRRIFERQIDEQILEDGGHFERSPMYHCLVLEDILDLINLVRCYGDSVPEDWWRTVATMNAWVEVMRHPDGQIPFFNDAAFGMALSPPRLEAYAESLNAPSHSGRSTKVEHPVHDLPATGYVRVQAGPAVMFLDLAPVGPDYIPAHAHADTLSFELSLAGQRLLVNSGTSTYERGGRREIERSTAAHNTVELDRQNSSEVWGGFRVARRARVTHRDIPNAECRRLRVTGEHDGYRRLAGGPVHRREWHVEPDGLIVVDRIEGDGEHRVDLRFHIHPRWNVGRGSEHVVLITGPHRGGRCKVRFEGPGRLALQEGCYAPEFGRLEPMVTLRYETATCRLPIEVRTFFSWANVDAAPSI